MRLDIEQLEESLTKLATDNTEKERKIAELN